MKPADHPEFFRFPAPEGRSRESTIVLDAEGRFFHDGERVAHPKLEAAMHTWIARHPDDDRWILTNGYDWTYLTVQGTPYFVRELRADPTGIVLVLSDGTEEPFDPTRTRVDTDDALVTQVKTNAPHGPFEAKLSRHAQTSLAPWLEQDDQHDTWVVLGNERVRLGKQGVGVRAAERIP